MVYQHSWIIYQQGQLVSNTLAQMTRRNIARHCATSGLPRKMHQHCCIEKVTLDSHRHVAFCYRASTHLLILVACQSIAQLFNQLTNQSIIRFLWRKARERGCAESSESRRAAVVTVSINNESQGRYQGGGGKNPCYDIHYSAARVKRVRRKRLYHGGTPENVVMGEAAELPRVLTRTEDKQASFQILSPSAFFRLILLLDTLPLKTFTRAAGDFDALLLIEWALASMIKGEGAVNVGQASREGVTSDVEAWSDKRC